MLTVLKNTGSSPISGTFDNLVNGGTISAIYNCTVYTFTANYSGGSGDDLTLTLQSKNFSQWETNNGFTGGPGDPPGNDGIPNLLKYVCDIDPSSPVAADRSALPVFGMTTTGVATYLTLTYRQYASLTGVTITVQTSPDLQTWTTVSPPDLAQLAGADSTTGDPIMEVGVIATSAKQFLRLNVTQP